MLRVGKGLQCLRPISLNSILLNFLPVREIIHCSIHSPFPLFIRHLLNTCHIPGAARNTRHNLINSAWSQSSKKSKATKKAFVNTQVHCNIIWKALGTQCHGSPEEIINNFPNYARKACFIWMFKNEKELLSLKNGGSSQGKGNHMYHKASELHRAMECLSNRETYLDRMRPEGYGERQTWRSRLGPQTKWCTWLKPKVGNTFTNCLACI